MKQNTTLRTVPISNWKIVEMYVKSIPLTRIYMTTHFSVLVQTLHEKSGGVKLALWAQYLVM